MKKAIGIDIGGTGIKGALVNVKKGALVSDRIRFDTPNGATPKEVLKQVAIIIESLDAPEGAPVGICFPAVIKNGRTLSAANVSSDWIGLNAQQEFEKALERDVVLLNDADAAGIAEMKFGAGANVKGLVLMATLGTGIGTALFMNGKLIPNVELGHIEIDGVDYETRASFSAKERDNLSFRDWAERLTKYFSALNRLLSLDLVIIGGGVSKQHQEFLPLIDCGVKIVPAESRNNAGIIGAAFHAAKKL
ncbi:MAG: polyphosphate--glucose phosphotransferase [Actinomycetota bacterium]